MRLEERLLSQEKYDMEASGDRENQRKTRRSRRQKMRGDIRRK
jgi:hypothetical protein